MAAVAWAHPPSQATVCDDNPDVAQIVYGGGKLYQRHYDGSIHLFNGPNQYWRWTTIQGAGDTLVGIAANHKHLYKMKTNGELSRYNEATQAWDLVKTLIHIKDYVISDSKFYYLKGIHGGASEGIQMEDIDDPSPSYEELEGLLKQVQTRSKSQDNEISRLKAGKEADEKIINQLRNENRDYQAQVTKLTADLKAARDQAAKTESDLQSQIANLQKDLLAAQNAEKKLSEDLDTEKKKEYDEWKKSQEHDAEDHKALDQAHQALQESQALGAELQKQIDILNEEVSTTKAANERLKDEVADAKTKEGLAEAELKKHKNDDAAEEQIIEGLEEVIKGLKKEVHGQQELLSAYKKQLQKGNIKFRDPSNKFFMDVLRHK